MKGRGEKDMSKVCTRCKAQLPDNVMFCNKCGQKITFNQTINTNVERNNLSKKKQTFNPAYIILITLGVFATFGIIVIIALGGLFSFGTSTTIDLNDYVIINADGYDSIGRANYSFEREAFDKKYSSKIKNANGSVDSPSDMLLSTCTNPSFDKAVDLSNGDVVIFSWDCDEQLAKDLYNVNIKCSDITYTVDGLTPVGSFNPFDYITVDFVGTSPFAEVRISEDSSREELEYIKIETDKEHHLTIGEEVLVTASCYNRSEFVEKFGMKLEEEEKIYEVDNVGKYITSLSEIPPDLYNEMDQKLREKLISDFDSWENEKLLSMTLLGNQMHTPKDSAATELNSITFVYEVTAENDASNGSFTYYWRGSYNNVSIDKTGNNDIDALSWDVLTNYGLFTIKSEETGGYLYAGSFDLDDLISNEPSEHYNLESTVQK